jgi:hypothetical protein
LVSQILGENERELEVCKTKFNSTEGFHSFARPSLNPEELRLTVYRLIGIDWDPESVGHLFSTQALFVDI